MKKGLKQVLIGVIILLFAGIAALLIWEYVQKGKIETDTLTKAAFVAASLVIAIARIVTRDNGAEHLRYKQYEELYSEYIENAFTRPEQKKQRKELLKAIDLYNSNNYAKALEILGKLQKQCGKNADSFAVNIFKGLCYSEMGVPAKAIEAYKSILVTDDKKSAVWSNLGLLYVKEGRYAEAEEAYKKAIEKNEKDPYPYNNAAILYLRQYRYEDAIEYALKALEIKNNMHQASNTLAIVYTLTGELDLADKYFKISVANGVDAEGLRATIDRFCEELD